MKILIFGTGDYYNRYKKWFEGQEISALLDNSVQRQYTVIDGREVLPPEEGIKLEYDIIVVLSFYVRQMKQQLISLGVEPERIYHFFDLHRLFASHAVRRPLKYFSGAEGIIRCGQAWGTKVLLLSHDLTLGGPAIALFHAAQVLINHGYLVVFASVLDGPLREELMKLYIPVVVDENIQITAMQETEWIKSFSLVICNTMNFHVFLSRRDTSIPVIWWLHDARFFYDGVDQNIMKMIRLENLKVVSVGPVPAEAVRDFRPDMDCEELLYGVDDFSLYDDCHDRLTDEVRFITIGFLEDIKGQDVLVEAVRILPENIRHKCIFYIVGHDRTLFGEWIHKESAGLCEIKFTGSVSRREIHTLFCSSDVLICPSRQDSMPTVAAEAMMHSVPCIVSDAVGTSAYIHGSEDGFVFPSENVQELAKIIEWCVTNKTQLKSIGRKARKLYEQYFSMTVFEKRLMEVIHKPLGQ